MIAGSRTTKWCREQLLAGVLEGKVQIRARSLRVRVAAIDGMAVRLEIVVADGDGRELVVLPCDPGTHPLSLGALANAGWIQVGSVVEVLELDRLLNIQVA